jgi:c-di-GMP-binding flagellar brake protein YcgR
MMIAERRRAERVRVNLDVSYTNGRASQHKGTISDISVTGCFVLSAGEEEAHQPVTVNIELPSGKVVQLTGEVVYNTPEIGFAVRFTELPAGTLNFVEKLVKRFSQTSKHPDRAVE